MPTRLLTGLLVLCAAALPAIAGDLEDDGDGRPVARYFRFELAGDPPVSIPGILITGTGDPHCYAAYLLDLDGDGRYEIRHAYARDEEEAIEFDLGGRRYSVEISPECNVTSLSATLAYAVSDETSSAWFINGYAPLFEAREDAAHADPTHLGPPFHFAVETAVRGPDALLSVGLRDGNGCTLRRASSPAGEQQIHVRLGPAGAPVLDRAMEYG